MQEDPAIEHAMEHAPETQDEAISATREGGQEQATSTQTESGGTDQSWRTNPGYSDPEQRSGGSAEVDRGGDEPGMHLDSGSPLKAEEPQWESQETGRVHIVEQDETLYMIAQNELGDGERWKELAELNADRIANPDLLYPGQEIVLPR